MLVGNNLICRQSEDISVVVPLANTAVLDSKGYSKPNEFSEEQAATKGLTIGRSEILCPI